MLKVHYIAIFCYLFIRKIDSTSILNNQNILKNSKFNDQVSILQNTNPAFKLKLTWEPGVDIDLYVKFNNKYCDSQRKKTNFGKWKMDQSMMPNNLCEIFYQDDIIEGEYYIYANLYRPKHSSKEITLFAELNPVYGEKVSEKLVKMIIKSTKPPFEANGGTYLGKIKLSKNSFTFTPVRIDDH